MTRIKISNTASTSVVTMRIQDNVISVIERASERMGSSRSQWMRQAVIDRLRAEGRLVDDADLDGVQA